MPNDTKVAYVEYGSTGHRPVWIRSVCDAVEHVHLTWNLDVWVPADFRKLHSWSEQYWNSNTGTQGRIHFWPLESAVRSGPGALAGMYDIALCCAKHSQSDVCFVGNSFDVMVSALALERPNIFPGRIVGVSDRPFLHYRKFHSMRTKKWIRPRNYYSTLIKLYMMCRRDHVGTILMLDRFAPPYYNRLLQTHKFDFLPEYVQTSSDVPNLREYLGLPDDRAIFLMIGSIYRGKGVLETLAAFRLLLADNPSLQQKVSIVIAGRVADDLRSRLHEQLRGFSDDYPALHVRVEDRTLGDDEFSHYIKAADVVCTPYVNFLGTSSILVHAAAYGRQVLSSDFGYLGEAVHQYDLGVTCNEADSLELKQGLLTSLNQSCCPNHQGWTNGRYFVEQNAIPLESYGEAICSILAKNVKA